MNWILPIEEIAPKHAPEVGGKAAALARLAQNGLAVPPTLCVSAAVYQHFLSTTGLHERIMTELNRKPFEQMRWEEIWDSALRIRNMFSTTPLPADITAAVTEAIDGVFAGRSVVLRSSAPGEDSSQASFAGVHESFLNIRGPDEILRHIRLVWASLWSDAALLYRQELGLDARHSAMAVLVQTLVAGTRSGIFFGVNPNDADQSVLEAVYGLNQGLVDGRIEPDRWIIERTSGRLVDHHAPLRHQRMIAGVTGVEIEALPSDIAGHPPVTAAEITEILSAGRRAESVFGRPQDIEWTLTTKGLVILQSRPITSGDVSEAGDKRAWYLSLHRSFENLKALEARITQRLIPEMVSDAEALAALDLTQLSDAQLATEIERRRKINDHWVQVYWTDFIPFAHGMRLFGQFYNDSVQPQDPYEFMRLLEKSDLISMTRNLLLTEMAQMVRSDDKLRKRLTAGQAPRSGEPLDDRLKDFIDQFGDLTCPVTGGAQCRQGPEAVIRIVLEMATGDGPPQGHVSPADRQRLRSQFLDRFGDDRRDYAAALLDLARTSYKLRDDDNLHLGRIETQLYAALHEARLRLYAAEREPSAGGRQRMLKKVLAGFVPPASTEDSEAAASAPVRRMKARQIVGQPAGPGIASGTARVIQRPDELFDFKKNEILVCDAVDPNMTFVIPLAAAVVERRGGMLIHGAIIAREYGIPCVTGVPEATLAIESGDQLTVDGFLGIVTLGSSDL
jgi:pyruvate,water dikinase